MSDVMQQPPVPLPAEKSRDQLTNHNYDGIQEYDNPTPGWWVWIFVVSVMFAILYVMYYMADVDDRSVYDRYGDSVGAYQKKKLAALGITELVVNEPNMLKWMTNRGFMDYGRA